MKNTNDSWDLSGVKTAWVEIDRASNQTLFCVMITDPCSPMYAKRIGTHWTEDAARNWILKQGWMVKTND